ncbi:hypothetical protein ACFY4C_23365 [Actinomadura viridis]|uniref:hypothetical protein n=1 Tax=Actinomadura viridis TaxID=58110 RepID=UPI00369C42BD
MFDEFGRGPGLDQPAAPRVPGQGPPAAGVLAVPDDECGKTPLELGEQPFKIYVRLRVPGRVDYIVHIHDS